MTPRHLLIEHPDGSSERWRYHPRFDFVVSHVDVRGFETRQVYDNRGNVIERIEAEGLPEERRTEYTWTAAGELETLTQKSAAGDAVTRWTYDADGNVSSMTDAEDQVREYRAYTPEGMAREEEDARGHVWERQCNAAGWLLEQESPLGTVIESRYDRVGNRIEQRQPVAGSVVAVTKYRYDALNRLVEATPPVGLQVGDTNREGLPIERHRYGRVHNRLESDHQPGTWIYNANSELQSYGAGTERRVLSYDANGSTVREELGDPAFQVTDYVYDPERSEASEASDRLIEVKRDGVTQVEYAYDPYGQRIWRETKPVSVEGATVTWFLYSTEGLIGEYRADGSLIREYGWLPNGLWGTDPVWQHDATGMHVMHNDHLFTPERMTRAGESAVSWAGTREAFGRVAVQPGSSTTMLLRFPGQWEDGVGGFYQNWWREYGAGVGRYRSVDPIGLWGGVSLFGYTAGNPIGGLDNRGLKAWFCSRPMRGTEIVRPLIIINHYVICVTKEDGEISCGGFGPDSDTQGVPYATPIFGTPGKFFDEKFGDLTCDLWKPDDCPRCFEDCVLRKFDEERRWGGARRYSITPQGTDCQEWAHDVWMHCGAECKDVSSKRPQQCTVAERR